MTRINSGFPPRLLKREHLLAEHREIKRIPNSIREGRYNLSRVPETFRLGTGHVSFFYDKLEYLRYRYEEIYSACIERNYNVQYYGDCWKGLPKNLFGAWSETTVAQTLILSRLIERDVYYRRFKKTILEKIVFVDSLSEYCLDRGSTPLTSTNSLESVAGESTMANALLQLGVLGFDSSRKF